MKPQSRTALRRAPAYTKGLHGAVPAELTPKMAARMDQEVQRLLDQARCNETSGPKAHHLVPNSYLKRWAVADRIRVTETTSRRTYSPGPEKAATETRFYRLEHEDLDPADVPPLIFETLLSKIEGNAVPAVDHLVKRGPIGLRPDDAVWLSIYLAFQITRGRSFRAAQQESLENLLRVQHPATQQATQALLEQNGNEATPEALAETLEALRALHSGAERVSPTTAEMISISGEAAMQISPHLLARNWLVYWTDLSSFITCDESVVILNGPETSRRERGGYGTADVVIFPLSPTAVLAMFHPHHDLDSLALWRELDAIEVADLNLEIAPSSHRWLFERPDRHRRSRWPSPPYSPQPVCTAT